MDEQIACCGLACRGCPIYLATREQDPKKKREMRAQIARQINDLYKENLRAEDVTDCDGCKAKGGRLFSGSRTCEIRKCAGQKGVENCAHCNGYACAKLEKFFVTDPDARKRLGAIRNAL
jgi:Protein of unknown function (DUF3795)